MSPLYHDKFKEKKDKLVPGPGSYEHVDRAMRTAPNYGFGTSQQRANPELGSKGVSTEIKYNPEHTTTKNKSPKYKFGTSVRKGMETKSKVPGAGNYTLKSQAFPEGFRFHMGQKVNELSKLDVPGSGSYNVDQRAIRKSASSFTMGIKLKNSLDLNKQKLPGPGTYDSLNEKVKNAAPKFAFGTSKRAEITGPNKLQTPGPGDYKLPGKIGYIPTYV